MKKHTIKLLLGLIVSCLTSFASAESDKAEIVPAPSSPSVTQISSDIANAALDNRVAATEVDNPAADGNADTVSNPVANSAEQPDVQSPEAIQNNGEADADGSDGAEEVNPIEEEEGGFLIKDANINDIFQLLAKRAEKQYFHNNKLNSEEYKVTGHLNGDVSALKQMQELGFQYGLRMYVKGDTIYAMLDEQLNNLPAKEWTYSLNYLRPTDIEQIKALITPMLTAGRGIVNYEPKTNTIVVIDTTTHIEMVEALLKKIDKPKGQIVVEVKILRVNSAVGKNQGVDWSSSLGETGTSIDIIRSLNSVFGLEEPLRKDWGEKLGVLADPGIKPPTYLSTNGADPVDGLPYSEAVFDNSNIVLSPLQLRGVLRALNEGNMVTQKSNPVVITEDNEKASISLIDRVPIVTSTTTTNGTGPPQISEEVRYTIDSGDSTDPDTTREIGVTITMTPSLLPDGTIRMHMRPRNAQIVENIRTESGNVYPRVSEATIQSIARIPNGHSLIIGGFYGELDSKGKNKVPLLGDIPIINFFFKSKQTKKERSSLIFVVTPTSYDPSSVASHQKASSRLRKRMEVDSEMDWVDVEPVKLSRPRKVRGMYPQR